MLYRAAQLLIAAPHNVQNVEGVRNPWYHPILWVIYIVPSITVKINRHRDIIRHLRLDEVFAVEVSVAAHGLVQVLLLFEFGLCLSNLLLVVKYLHLANLDVLHVLQDLHTHKHSHICKFLLPMDVSYLQLFKKNLFCCCGFSYRTVVVAQISADFPVQLALRYF